MAKENKFPDASISFDIEVNEEAEKFFERMMKEHEDVSAAVGRRILQLFDEKIVVENDSDDKAKQIARQIFSVGYQLGWNDRCLCDK